MLFDVVTDSRADDARVRTTGVDVTGLDSVAGLRSLPRGDDGTVDGVQLTSLASTLDIDALDDVALVETAALWDRITAWTQAMHYAVVSELTRCPADVGGVERRPHAVDDNGELVRAHAPDEVAAAIGLSVRGGESRVWTAIGLLEEFPKTFSALASGRIDVPRALAMLDEASGLCPDDRDAVEARVLDAGRRDSPGRFRRAVRRAVVHVDAEGARRRAERARADTYVRTGALADDMASLDAHLAAEDAMAVRLVLDAAASAMRGDDRTRTVDQLRAAALAAPFWAALASGALDTPDGPLGLAVAHGRSPALDLELAPPESGEGEPAGRLGDVPFATAELRGFGPITGGLAQALATRSSTGARPVVRVSVRGAAAAVAAAEAWPVQPSYRPAQALLDHVTDRDRHCRFPGCSVAARWCDLDHTIAWPVGPTHPANLALLCRRHHRLKQSRLVTLAQPGAGTLTWTMPTGHRYETGPPD